MRPLFFLIVLAAIGFVGWKYYQGTLPLPQTGIPEDAEPAPSSEPRLPVARVTPATPVFKSRIHTENAVREGEKKVAPPGAFYVLERVSAQTKDGSVAAVPGDEVKLVRRAGDKLHVSLAETEFEVKESQVTRDLALAQEAERKEFARRHGPP
jgi:hypothetical protein